MFHINYIGQVVSRTNKNLMKNKLQKHFSTTSDVNYKVALLGASGRVGQPLALLLKSNPLISTLALHDVKKYIPGIALELSHINNTCTVEGYHGDGIENALLDADIVIIATGNAHKAGMEHTNFQYQADLVYRLATSISKFASKALVAVITNPVNSIVPIVSSVLAKTGYFDPLKIFGVTTLNSVRAATIVGQECHVDPAELYIPVIGGHGSNVSVPVLSQCAPAIEMSQDMVKKITTKLQITDEEVEKAKMGGPATLSTAFAAARFTDSLLRGLQGEFGIVECAYVKSNVTDAEYFSSPLILGKTGVIQNLGFGELTTYEDELVTNAISQIKEDITAGKEFIAKKERVYESTLK